jgi:uncharacterized protein (UPF0305 family)
MEPMERDVPLSACPDTSCGRKRYCLKWAYHTYCLKTHYRNHDEWRQEVVDRINELRKEKYYDPVRAAMTPDERASQVYQALKERARELGIPGH